MPIHQTDWPTHYYVRKIFQANSVIFLDCLLGEIPLKLVRSDEDLILIPLNVARFMHFNPEIIAMQGIKKGE